MKDYIEKCQILQSSGTVDSDITKWTSNHRLIGVKPDDFLSFQKTMKIRVFDMDHSIPSYGYGFYECREKLKEEYKHLTHEQIGNIKRENSNLELTEERLIPLFTFMGDTTASIFDKYHNELFSISIDYY